jgi:hypothetical protein
VKKVQNFSSKNHSCLSYLVENKAKNADQGLKIGGEAATATLPFCAMSLVIQ